MKKLKKFKRYDQGGAVGAGSGDPFSYTDFSDRARNLKKPSEAAEIDDSRERYASTSASGMMNPSLRPGQGRRRDDDAEKPAETASTAKPSVRDSAKDTAQTSFDYPAQRESKRDDYEGGASPTSGSQTFKRAAPKTPKEDTSYKDLENARANRTKPAAPAKPSGPVPAPASSSGQRSGRTEYERELEERKRRLNSEKTPAAPAKSKVPAKIDSEKLPRDTEEEVLRKKPTAMTEQMRKAPTINDLYRGQKSMGDEIGDALKSFRASIRQGNRQGKADALNEQSNPPPFDWRERKKNKGKFVIEHDEYAKGGKVKAYAQGGFVSRGDGCAQRGKTKGRMV
jgi:hypothetical protein